MEIHYVQSVFEGHCTACLQHKKTLSCMSSFGLVHQLAVLVNDEYVVEFQKSPYVMNETEYIQFLETLPSEKQKLQQVSNIAQSDTFWEDDMIPEVQLFWSK